MEPHSVLVPKLKLNTQSNATNNNNAFDHIVKVVAIGAPGVGKSSLILRATEDKFEPTMSSTIGVDFKILTVTTEMGTRIKCQVWDTAGQERFGKVSQTFYRGANAIVFVFDVCQLESFHKITDRFIPEARWEQPNQDSTFNCSYSRFTCGILVGNKTDNVKQRVVMSEHAQRVAESFDLHYIETSAKTGDNVQRIFQELANAIEHANTVLVDEIGETLYTPTGSFETIVLDKPLSTPRHKEERTSNKNKCCSYIIFFKIYII
jgi:Ras-related protein Rab-8A